MNANDAGNAAKVRKLLKHPVLDADGHWVESQPVFLEYLREVAGAKLTDEFIGLSELNKSWHQASPAERLERRLRRPQGSFYPTDTRERATAMLPGLMQERMGELGFDFSIIYPSNGLFYTTLFKDELRRASVRAYNIMVSETYAPYGRTFAPAAIIPTYTPQEAIEELDYAVGQLGCKVAMFRGALPRALMPADGLAGTHESVLRRFPYYIDPIGFESPHNYDPVWRKCVELKVAATFHGGSHDWADRKSVNSYVFNHIGHFAQGNHVICKGLFLAGVNRRFPDLNFAFLEGGVGYAVSLLWDLVGHWEKLNPKAMREYLDPGKTDLDALRKLIMQYGLPRTKSKVDEIIEGHQKTKGDFYEDFGRLEFSRKSDLIEQFSRSFYFGCEADDPVTTWAFDKRTGATLKAILGSDVSHFDVPEMVEVLPEAYEMVEKKWLTDDDFEEFAFSNAIRLHGGMNKDFFKGTTLEQAAAPILAATAAIA